MGFTNIILAFALTNQMDSAAPAEPDTSYIDEYCELSVLERPSTDVKFRLATLVDRHQNVMIQKYGGFYSESQAAKEMDMVCGVSAPLVS